MKKVLALLSAVAFVMVLSFSTNAQEPEKKKATTKAKTEKCCSTATKKACGEKAKECEGEKKEEKKVEKKKK